MGLFMGVGGCTLDSLGCQMGRSEQGSLCPQTRSRS